jgi:hypothetical protein
MSAVGDTHSKIFSNKTMGGKMDFTIKSEYKQLVYITTVTLRTFSGKSVLFGQRIFGYVPWLFHSRSRVQGQTYSDL